MQLKEDLSKHLGVSPAHLIIGNGSDEVLKLLAEAFFRPGDEVVVATPTFGEYAYTARLMGVGLVEVKAAEGLEHDLERMAAAVTPRTKAVFICNPNNPTGGMKTRAEWERFLDRIPDHVLIVLDQAYLEYVEDPAYPDGLITWKRKKLLVLRTFSKIYGLAGLRYGAWPAGTGLYNRVREPFSQPDGPDWPGGFDGEFLAKSRTLVREGKKQINQGLAEMGLEYLPSAANFVLFATPYPCREVYPRLLQKGVIIRPADIFGLPRHFRVTIGTAEENARFLQALREVLAEMG